MVKRSKKNQERMESTISSPTNAKTNIKENFPIQEPTKGGLFTRGRKSRNGSSSPQFSMELDHHDHMNGGNNGKYTSAMSASSSSSVASSVVSSTSTISFHSGKENTHHVEKEREERQRQRHHQRHGEKKQKSSEKRRNKKNEGPSLSSPLTPSSSQMMNQKLTLDTTSTITPSPKQQQQQQQQQLALSSPATASSKTSSKTKKKKDKGKIWKLFGGKSKTNSPMDTPTSMTSSIASTTPTPKTPSNTKFRTSPTVEPSIGTTRKEKSTSKRKKVSSPVPTSSSSSSQSQRIIDANTTSTEHTSNVRISVQSHDDDDKQERQTSTKSNKSSTRSRKSHRSTNTNSSPNFGSFSFSGASLSTASTNTTSSSHDVDNNPTISTSYSLPETTTMETFTTTTTTTTDVSSPQTTTSGASTISRGRPMSPASETTTNSMSDSGTLFTTSSSVQNETIERDDTFKTFSTTFGADSVTTGTATTFQRNQQRQQQNGEEEDGETAKKDTDSDTFCNEFLCKWDDFDSLNQNQNGTNANEKQQGAQSALGDAAVDGNMNENFNDDDYTIDEEEEEKADESDPTKFAISENDLREEDGDEDTTTMSLNELDRPLHEQQRIKSETLVLTRSALSRPFGRTSLPAHLAKRWFVEVSTFEFDEFEKKWMYTILVQKEEHGTTCGSMDGSSAVLKDHSAVSPNSNNDVTSLDMTLSMSSLPAANVKRSLHDFVWLEQALREEFCGGLLLPMLSLTLTSGTDWTTADSMDKTEFENGEWDPVALSVDVLDQLMKEQDREEENDIEGADGSDQFPQEVDAGLLGDWLSDVLNNVRGKGELILDQGHVDIMHSEAMERFLYGSKALPRPRNYKDGLVARSGSPSYAFGLGAFLHSEDNSKKINFASLNHLFSNPLSCTDSMDVCNFGVPDDNNNKDEIDSSSMLATKSESILNKRKETHERFKRPELYPLASHSEVLEAQRQLISIQREDTLRAMYCLRMVLEQEMLISAAWKRFAISLSNLFGFEKEIESSKIGESKSKKPQRKVSKKTMDDLLRQLCRQKIDRSVPSLKVLSGMLSAYFADFSTVDPSLNAFSDALLKIQQAGSSNKDDRWQSQLWSLSTFRSPNKKTVNHIKYNNDTAQQQMIRRRVLSQESIVKSSISQLFNSSDIRISRMAWKFFKMEAGQATLLSKQATKLRKKLKADESPPQSLSTKELEDNQKEIQIVQKMLDLGSKRKYKFKPLKKSGSASITSSENSENSMLDESITDNESEFEEELPSPLVEKALQIAAERAGHWDAEIVLTILEAAGVEDAEVLVEETTRDLRSVRKLTIGLRNNVKRCVEAVNMLKEVTIGKHTEDGSSTQITKLRERFISTLSIVFSGADDVLKRDGQESIKEILSSVGMVTSDDAGWMKARTGDNNETYVQGRCGEIALQYQKVRESQMVALFNGFSEMLADYESRIENIENFVYSHCLGIQLEKHFSRLRAEALAAWEKKTDITTAINIATRKRLPRLVKELKTKLAAVSQNVSHTSVKEAKERHLQSKALKAELDDLACRRFQRLKEVSTSRVHDMIKLWVKHEESGTRVETQVLSHAIKEIEGAVTRKKSMIEGDGGAHTFALIGGGGSLASLSSPSKNGSKSREQR